MSKYIFETRMEVRDYECDIQGIVNNANYLHYTEHTRHLFLQSTGLSFAEMHQRGVDAVVARMSLQYKTPLRCDDEFISRLWMEKQGLRYVLHRGKVKAGKGRNVKEQREKYFSFSSHPLPFYLLVQRFHHAPIFPILHLSITT